LTGETARPGEWRFRRAERGINHSDSGTANLRHAGPSGQAHRC
jgi:hypothetical protein